MFLSTAFLHTDQIKSNQVPYAVNYKTSNTICTGMFSADSEGKEHVSIVLGLPLIIWSVSWFALSCYMW